MKKFVAKAVGCILAAVSVFSLAACNNGGGESASESAKKLWAEALAFQSEYFTRLLRQLERSCATEEF